ncbi:MAG: hypothetical protein L6262_05885 [Weeksellaceae bacterium]|nr:hypothetical protein [Weeksellaceae bacterium]
MRKLFLILVLSISISNFAQKSTFAALNDFMIELPGKWKHTKDYQGSQFGFENKGLGGFLTVSIREAKKIEFFKPEYSNLSDFELLDQFYKWDSDYWKENPKNEVLEINKDEINKIIIWKVKPQTEESSFNYIVNGIQKGFIICIS